MKLNQEPSCCAVKIVSNLDLHGDIKDVQFALEHEKHFQDPIFKGSKKALEEILNDLKSYSNDSHAYGSLGDFYNSSSQARLGAWAMLLNAVVERDRERTTKGAPSDRTIHYHYIGYFAECQFRYNRCCDLWLKMLSKLGWIAIRTGESRHSGYDIGIIIKAPRKAGKR